MIICISGSPGSGKSTLAKKLAAKLKYKYLDVNRIISKHNLSEGFDKFRKTKIIDTKKLNKFLISIIKENPDLIIDSHLSHYLPKKYVDLCIITKCSLKKLESRLKKRGYSKAKIRENLDSEIFDICLNEAKELGHKIKVVDTSRRYSLKKILSLSS